jgi:hypothetical protein
MPATSSSSGRVKQSGWPGTIVTATFIGGAVALFASIAAAIAVDGFWAGLAWGLVAGAFAYGAACALTGGFRGPPPRARAALLSGLIGTAVSLAPLLLLAILLFSIESLLGDIAAVAIILLFIGMGIVTGLGVLAGWLVVALTDGR